MKNEYTQTEEIFFKMHWSYFSGQYKIMNCTKIIINNNNAFDFTDNILGQLKKSNLFNKQIDEGPAEDIHSYLFCSSRRTCPSVF